MRLDTESRARDFICLDRVGQSRHGPETGFCVAPYRPSEAARYCQCGFNETNLADIHSGRLRMDDLNEPPMILNVRGAGFALPCASRSRLAFVPHVRALLGNQSQIGIG